MKYIIILFIIFLPVKNICQTGIVSFSNALQQIKPDSLYVHNNESVVFKKEFEKNKISKVEIIPGKRALYFSESGLFKILLASATALGVAAAHFKLQADKKYDDLRSSHNDADMGEVNKLDLYSGIFFAALQINIGYIFYRLLSE